MNFIHYSTLLQTLKDWTTGCLQSFSNTSHWFHRLFIVFSRLTDLETHMNIAARLVLPTSHLTHDKPRSTVFPWHTVWSFLGLIYSHSLWGHAQFTYLWGKLIISPWVRLHVCFFILGLLAPKDFGCCHQHGQVQWGSTRPEKSGASSKMGPTGFLTTAELVNQTL